ncbi:M20 family metallopeptidase [Terrihalobacillus insolitus]|uniref:M20 family metallopeptidase n=1 Tax=Terrihalobacillus insolitus TaxID=2950438 RepID=UPI002341CA0C|nr:M20 family metallopeptidase [Terrihalobacillus insolitus]MDC3415010.1 M20 family metallopeptidase [Terrihalobacillus insolitus]
MIRFLEQQQQNMIDLIERLVNIDSGSINKDGVNEIGKILQEHFQEIGFKVDVVEEQEHGNHLVIQHEEATKPDIIILAHMDTVFPEGTASERPFHIKGDRAYGPGVIDMKSSIVSLLFAVKLLVHQQKKGYKNIQIILNSDEEMGSLTSRSLIEREAAGKKYALVMEPARSDGSLVTSRKGNGVYTLTVEGKAAHSGIEPEKGRSAIEELAHKVIQLHELSDYEKGISVSVGLIEGGSTVNTISDHAVAHIDVRISDLEQAESLERSIERICSTTDVSGTKTLLEGEINRPPMESNKENESLLRIIQDIGDEIGVNIEGTNTGGGSDASFTSALGIATIDGLGPVGGNPHSEKEYMDIPSLLPRTLLLATIIQQLTDKHT